MTPKLGRDLFYSYGTINRTPAAAKLSRLACLESRQTAPAGGPRGARPLRRHKVKAKGAPRAAAINETPLRQRASTLGVDLGFHPLRASFDFGKLIAEHLFHPAHTAFEAAFAHELIARPGLDLS